MNAANTIEGAIWIGAGLLSGGKGYVDAPMGQLHYRRAGPVQSVPVILLHQTAWSMVQYAEIQAHLASRGIGSIAFDTPGYGLSDPPPGAPTIAEYAQNLDAALSSLEVTRAIVAGHHTGAGIAIALAALNSARVIGVVAHGVPLFNAEERARYLEIYPHIHPRLDPIGAHLSEPLKHLTDLMGSDEANITTSTWSVITRFLSGAADIAHAAAFSYDLMDDLQAVRAKGLILSDECDLLHPNDQRAKLVRPDFDYAVFSSGDAHSLMNEPGRWADDVARFAASCS